MKNNVEDRSTDSASHAGKKPYRKPDLVTWGSLQELTASAGNKSIHVDGGKGASKRTS
jgi:hypothetical protein